MEVLHAALGLVAKHGFDAATLQMIADDVGRSKAGVLHHFGSRDALLLDIVRHRDAVNRHDFPSEPGFGASKRLVEHNQTVPGLVALFAVMSALAAADPQLTERREYFTLRYARLRGGFKRQLETAQAAAVIRSDLGADTLAVLIIAAMDGLQVQWLLDPTLDMVAHLAGLFELLAGTPSAEASPGFDAPAPANHDQRP